MSGRTPDTPELTLASTIGPIDAGLMPALLDAYRARTGLVVALTGAGTLVKELDVWVAAGITPSGDRYRLADQGTEGKVATAREAAALQRYTAAARRESTASLSHASRTPPEEDS
jgi:ABC-type tungstate transport system permease subunit